MKKVTNSKMSTIEAGVTGRTCMLLGYVTIAYIAFGQWGWALGTAAGAAGSGCFDR